MNIGFRVDSSSKVGTGHVNRCITLAENFKKKGIEVIFISRADSGNINTKIIKNGFKLATINSNKKNIIYDFKITNFFINKFNIDLLLVDNYSLNLIWEKNINKNCKIILLEDNLKRKTLCNYYINYHNYKKKNLDDKYLLNKKCIKFYGPKYSIIKKINLKKKIKRLNDIFIFMGGVDNKNFTSKIISILNNKNFKNYKVKIMVGEKNQRKDKIIKSLRKISNFSIVYDKYKDLYRFFKESKLIIINAGVSMYECLAYGSNSIIIPQSNDHKKILKNYINQNFINYINDIKKLNTNYILKKIQRPDTNLLRKRKEVFDTKGALRLANYFSSLK